MGPFTLILEFFWASQRRYERATKLPVRANIGSNAPTPGFACD
jgi:hypothetical protein